REEVRRVLKIALSGGDRADPHEPPPVRKNVDLRLVSRAMSGPPRPFGAKSLSLRVILSIENAVTRLIMANRWSVSPALWHERIESDRKLAQAPRRGTIPFIRVEAAGGDHGVTARASVPSEC